MQFLLLSFLLCVSIHAKAEWAVPALTGPVVDDADILDSQVESELSQLLRDIHSKGQGQIQVLTLKSLEGLTIEQASIEVAVQWKLGDAKKDDGILFLVAPKERKVRIEVGQGFEGVLTDLDSSRIIRRFILPEFKKGDYGTGVRKGTIAIVNKVAPEFGSSQSIQEKVEEKIESLVDRFLQILPIIIFILFILVRLLVRPGRFLRGGHGGFGGYSGGGFGGGGGGWSGGGGGFSGGGSSDSW